MIVVITAMMSSRMCSMHFGRAPPFLKYGPKTTRGIARAPAHIILASKTWWKQSLKQGKTWTFLPQRFGQYGTEETLWELVESIYQFSRFIQKCRRQDHHKFEPFHLALLNRCLIVILGLYGSHHHGRNLKLILMEPCLERIKVLGWES